MQKGGDETALYLFSKYTGITFFASKHSINFSEGYTTLNCAIIFYFYTMKIIFFDGVCNLCNRSVQLIIKHDKDDQYRFVSLQSPLTEKLMNDHKLKLPTVSSIVLMQDNKLFTESEAVLLICMSLYGWPYLFSFFKFIPEALRDYFYKIISKNRYRVFGRSDNCLIPSNEIKFKFLDLK